MRLDGADAGTMISLDHGLAVVAGPNLTLALVKALPIPTLLLDVDLRVLAASDNFLACFKQSRGRVIGRLISGLGRGEWRSAQLCARLWATASGAGPFDAYEMDLIQAERPTRRLVIQAQKLDHGSDAPIRVLLTINDVTAAREIERLNASLLAEKVVMMQELQHRVANSLQIIASVILRSARQVDSEEGRRHLHAAHSRVMSVADLQRILASKATDQVALGPYFAQLAASLTDSMIPDPQQLVVKVDVDDSLAPPEVATSLGLLATELVINAIKHAFPEGRAGVITIDYHRDASGWALQVQDDGVGMPRGPAVAEPGLGTSIIRALAAQLGAQVKVSDAAPGACVRIHRDAHTPQPSSLAL